MLSAQRDDTNPLLALAFKLEAGKFGQLTYMRVYQGKLARGSTLVNTRTQQKIKVSRLARMHAQEMEVTSEICIIYLYNNLSQNKYRLNQIEVNTKKVIF